MILWHLISFDVKKFGRRKLAHTLRFFNRGAKSLWIYKPVSSYHDFSVRELGCQNLHTHTIPHHPAQSKPSPTGRLVLEMDNGE